MTDDRPPGKFDTHRRGCLDVALVLAVSLLALIPAWVVITNL